MTEGTLIKTHDIILEYLMKYKKRNPNFVFWPRQRNTRKRLEKGYWFQGNENYIFVPLYRRGCSDNKTKTIGFVVTDRSQYIEIVYKNIDNETDEEIEFHEDLIKYLKSLEIFDEEKRGERHYFFLFKGENINENLQFFINDFKNKADSLLNKYSIQDKYIISEDKFQKIIKTINKYRTKRAIINRTTTKDKKKTRTRNTILYGVPGTGKTYNANIFISLIENSTSEQKLFDTIRQNKLSNKSGVSDINEQKAFITFHQSFGYEDFIEGFRPNKEGQIELVDGVFKRLCDKARQDREKNYYLVIDEINRGNISKIFGELITLIEEDKRDTYEVTLPYSKEKFSVPENLYIIGTMNSTDKSIALIDVALRRRFTFLKLEPNPDLIGNEKAKATLIKLNETLREKLGDEHLIGHSYFMDIESDDDLDFVLQYKIKPLLEEYFYGEEESLREILEQLPQL